MEVWEKYTVDNMFNLNGFNIFLLTELKNLNYISICEIGCNVGNNLINIPTDKSVVGLDMCDLALSYAKKKFSDKPNYSFMKINIITDEIPHFMKFDIIFTRGVLIHIPEKNMYDVINKIWNMSNKYIIHAEYYSDSDGEEIIWKRGKDMLWKRNLLKWYDRFNDSIKNIYTMNFEDVKYYRIEKLC